MTKVKSLPYCLINFQSKIAFIIPNVSVHVNVPSSEKFNKEIIELIGFGGALRVKRRAESHER